MFKRIIALSLICYGLAILTMFCSASITISDDTNSYTFQFSSTDAYAWTNEYIFVLHGAFEDEYDWMASYYSLTRIDRGSGDYKIIMQNIYGYLQKVFIHKDKLLLVSKNREGIVLMVVNYEGDIIEETDIDLIVRNDEYLLYEDSVYLTAEDGIYEINLENYDFNKLYTSSYKIKNSRDYKPFIYKNHLYFIEYSDIKALNLESKKIDISIKATLPTYNDLLKVFEKPLLRHQFRFNGYPYVIINDVLFYIDSELMSTVSRRIDQSEEKILDKLVFFKQFDNNGCLVVFLFADKYQIVYYTYEEIDKEDFIFQEERGITMPVDTCLVGYNEYILLSDCYFYSEFGGNTGYLDSVIIPLYNLPL